MCDPPPSPRPPPGLQASAHVVNALIGGPMAAHYAQLPTLPWADTLGITQKPDPLGLRAAKKERRRQRRREKAAQAIAAHQQAAAGEKGELGERRGGVSHAELDDSALCLSVL